MNSRKEDNHKDDSVAPQIESRREPVTIDQVAQMAGVSQSTVSRFLNGTAVVSERKRQAINDAIAASGYVPNPVARGLAGGRTFSIGVITQAIDSPFYGAALRGIEDELEPAGYSPLFVSGHWNVDLESRCLEVLRSRRVDGIIILTGRLPDETLISCAASVPVVVTGRTLDSHGLASINFDNFEGARLATEHLLDLGHRKIALIAGDPAHPDAVERTYGYRAAIEAAGLRYERRLVVSGGFSEAGGQEAVNLLVTSGQDFTAVFAANDEMAFGAAIALRRHGFRIPDDVSIVGFDDLPAARYANPPLTTIRQPAYELGRLAAAQMFRLLNGQQPDAEVPAPLLIARESSGPIGLSGPAN
jgi:LacI family transcriptional regulator